MRHFEQVQIQQLCIDFSYFPDGFPKKITDVLQLEEYIKRDDFCMTIYKDIVNQTPILCKNNKEAINKIYRELISGWVEEISSNNFEYLLCLF